MERNTKKDTSQIDRFKEAARQLEADENETAFDEKLKGIVSEKPRKNQTGK